MDQYFNQMEKIVKERKTSSRIRFMLQDVIDLRLVSVRLWCSLPHQTTALWTLFSKLHSSCQAVDVVNTVLFSYKSLHLNSWCGSIVWPQFRKSYKQWFIGEFFLPLQVFYFYFIFYFYFFFCPGETDDWSWALIYTGQMTTQWTNMITPVANETVVAHRSLYDRLDCLHNCPLGLIRRYDCEHLIYDKKSNTKLINS